MIEKVQPAFKSSVRYVLMTEELILCYRGPHCFAHCPRSLPERGAGRGAGRGAQGQQARVRLAAAQSQRQSEQQLHRCKIPQGAAYPADAAC